MEPRVIADARAALERLVMIEAGLKMLFDYDPDFSNERDIVAEIFMAMQNASASLYRREHL